MKWLIVAVVIAFSCSLEEGPTAEIRAHTINHAGVVHPIGLQRANRYCKECHGENLNGGANGEPSCYRCHGENWIDSDPDQNFAPEDHTALQGGRYYHDPSLFAPAGSCTSCHGDALQGSSTGQNPSCYLCHDQRWD